MGLDVLSGWPYPVAVGALFVIMLPFVVQALVPLLPSWFPFYTQISSNIFAVQLILYGLAIIIFMRVAPKGLAYSLARVWHAIVPNEQSRRRRRKAESKEVGR